MPAHATRFYVDASGDVVLVESSEDGELFDRPLAAIARPDGTPVAVDVVEYMVEMEPGETTHVHAATLRAAARVVGAQGDRRIEWRAGSGRTIPPRRRGPDGR